LLGILEWEGEEEQEAWKRRRFVVNGKAGLDDVCALFLCDRAFGVAHAVTETLPGELARVAFHSSETIPGEVARASLHSSETIPDVK